MNSGGMRLPWQPTMLRLFIHLSNQCRGENIEEPYIWQLLDADELKVLS